MTGPPPGSRLRTWARRLTASEDQREEERLRRDATGSGAVLAASVGRGDLARLTGRLRTVVYHPRANAPTLEAELYDGTDPVTLVWWGRRRILGLEPGRTVTVHGRIALRDGVKVIYNPRYELHPS